MSQMIPQPPSSIQVGGGGAPGGGGGQGGSSDPDASNVVSLLKQALQALQGASSAEQDPIDAAKIHQLATGVAQQIAAEQKLTDDVMGAGPGVKMVRKTAQAQGGSGY